MSVCGCVRGGVADDSCALCVSELRVCILTVFGLTDVYSIDLREYIQLFIFSLYAIVFVHDVRPVELNHSLSLFIRCVFGVKMLQYIV